MNTAGNVFLLTAAATLVSLGANTMAQNLLAGAVEFILGIGAFLVYELVPLKTQ
jgi:hypothetical protein